MLKHSEETKKKISNTKLATPRIITKEMINKYRNNSPLKKTVYQYDLEGNFIKDYPSINEAARCLGIGKDSISLCIRKKQNTGANFQWFDSLQDKVDPIKKFQKPQTWMGNKKLLNKKY